MQDFLVTRYAAFSVLVPVQAVTAQDALDLVCQGDGDWEAYEPRYQMQLGIGDDTRRYIPHINDTHQVNPELLDGAADILGFRTSFQELVDRVKALDDQQWQLLLAERCLCMPLEGL